MRITPRREEVKVIVDLLESDQFDSAEAMAKALIKEVAELMDMRDWVALTHRFGEQDRVGINWGPFASDSEATKYASKIGINGKFTAVKLYSPGLLLANATQAKRPTKDFCTNPFCMHAGSLHSAVGNGRGKCVLELCPCEKFATK
ncbi:hypothetical protein [Micromonospora sp. GCM10011541]|uniref:hypothetical protein n=1 Tax=Micromonospora sp. GCM10011541 TaxID=3317336 RepID=UPI0036167B86